MMRYCVFFFFVVFLSVSTVLGEGRVDLNQDHTKKLWYLPDGIKLQYCGNIGLFAGGVNYNVFRWYQFSIMYGMAPSHTDVKTLNTVAFKNTFMLKKFHYKKMIVVPTSGFSINFGSTHNTYREFPDYFPDGYYFQNKIHFAPFVGMAIYHPLSFRTIKGIDFYYEIGTMDNYLLEGVRTKYVKMSEIWNLGLGVTLHF